MIYPPYCDLAQIVLHSESREKAQAAAYFVFESIKKGVEAEYSDVKINILGPAIANVPKINNKYRFRLLVKFKNFARFGELLHKVIGEFFENDSSKSAGISVDINPESIV